MIPMVTDTRLREGQLRPGGPFAFVIGASLGARLARALSQDLVGRPGLARFVAASDVKAHGFGGVSPQPEEVEGSPRMCLEPTDQGRRDPRAAERGEDLRDGADASTRAAKAWSRLTPPTAISSHFQEPRRKPVRHRHQTGCGRRAIQPPAGR